MTQSVDGKARITATRNNTPTVSSGAKMIAYGDPNLQDVITGGLPLIRTFSNFASPFLSVTAYSSTASPLKEVP